jgi:hypothetical protein
VVALGDGDGLDRLITLREVHERVARDAKEVLKIISPITNMEHRVERVAGRVLDYVVHRLVVDNWG